MKMITEINIAGLNLVCQYFTYKNILFSRNKHWRFLSNRQNRQYKTGTNISMFTAVSKQIKCY